MPSGPGATRVLGEGRGASATRTWVQPRPDGPVKGRVRWRASDPEDDLGVGAVIQHARDDCMPRPLNLSLDWRSCWIAHCHWNNAGVL